LNDNISLTENKSSPSDIFVGDDMVESLPNSPDSMPSFTEWKKKMLSENEDKVQVLTQSDSSSKIASSVDLPTSNIKGSSERVRNYASYECGAKVIASNPEAESTPRILNEMMDEYLLNPCKVKIWFVIELCESLRPSSLQLANFELFSSTPKDFLVFGSDQYPTHDWLSLGSFTAQDIRGLQRFELTSQSQYLKYIRVEMLSNYGYEHYCPLSVIRVYGTSMVEEFDAIERSSRTKSIETLTDDEKKGIESSTAEESLESDKSKQNLLGSAREVVINMVKKAAMALTKTPSLNSANCTDGDQEDDENELDLSSHLYVLKMSSKLESQKHLNWLECFKEDTSSNCTLNLSFCNYLQLLLGKKIYTILSHEFVKESDLRFKCLTQLPLYLNITIKESESVTLNNSLLPLVLPNETLLLEPDTIKKNISKKLSESLNDKDIIISLKTELSEPSLSSTSSLKIVPSSTEASLPVSSSLSEPNNVIDLNVSLVTNQTLINATKNESLLPIDESIDINKIQASSDSVSVSSVHSSNPHPPTQPVNKPLVQSSQSPSNGPNVIPLSGTQSKESVFIRMTNKIRALEVNLSLSSQYLEELSQSYRKNMEEMQKAFNRTITKLNETARFAAQQDDKQQEMLEELQRKYSLIEDRVALLINEKETLHWQFVEIHILLLIIEIFIIICIFSVCVRRLSSRFDESKVYHCNLNPFYFKSKCVSKVHFHDQFKLNFVLFFRSFQNHSLKRPSSAFEDMSNCSPAKNKRIEGNCLFEVLHLNTINFIFFIENLIIVEPSYSIFPPIHPIKVSALIDLI